MSAPDFSLAGRTALVTGANSGIGRAIALGLAAQGADLVVHHHGYPEEVAAIRKEAAALGRKVEIVAADFARAAEVTRLAEQAVAGGPIDIIVANAAMERVVDWMEIDEPHVLAHAQVNLAALLELCRVLVPPMAARGWGRVVAIGSIMARRPAAQSVVYAALKSAQSTAIRALAREVAGRGVTMNVIAPGAIETPRHARRYADPDFRRAVSAKIPAARPGAPEDCVGAAVLLCSNAGSYITGAEIAVDGGWSAGDAPGRLPGPAT